MKKPGELVRLTYLAVIGVSLFLAVPARAQIRTTEPTEVRFTARFVPWHWTNLTKATILAGAFDIETTHAVKRSVTGNEVAHENDFMAQPFAFHREREYPVMILGYAALGAVAFHMQRSSGWSRHVWWVPQTFAIGIHVFCGVHNIHAVMQN
jgi:hypothetical protein